MRSYLLLVARKRREWALWVESNNPVLAYEWLECLPGTIKRRCWERLANPDRLCKSMDEALGHIRPMDDSDAKFWKGVAMFLRGIARSRVKDSDAIDGWNYIGECMLHWKVQGPLWWARNKAEYELIFKEGGNDGNP